MAVADFNVSKAFGVLILLMSALSILNGSVVVKQSIGEDKASNQTICDCGPPENGEEVIVDLKMCTTDSHSVGAEHIACNEEENHVTFAKNKICNNFLNCKTCDPLTHSCLTCPNGTMGTYCDKKDENSILDYRDDELDSIYPIHVTFPREKHIVEHRVLREYNKYTCQLPSLTTVNLDCNFYKHKVTCSERCVWGYTFDEGTTRTSSCYHSQNTWSPSILEECQPFVNCKLGIVVLGTIMKCHNLMVESPIHCEISCYGNKPNIYYCRIDGSWNPPLPPCVKPKENVPVVSIPCAEVNE